MGKCSIFVVPVLWRFLSHWYAAEPPDIYRIARQVLFLSGYLQRLTTAVPKSSLLNDLPLAFENEFPYNCRNVYDHVQKQRNERVNCTRSFNPALPEPHTLLLILLVYLTCELTQHTLTTQIKAVTCNFSSVCVCLPLLFITARIRCNVLHISLS